MAVFDFMRLRVPVLLFRLLVVSSLCISSSAVAQDSNELPLLVEITEGERVVEPLNVSVAELEEMTIYGADGDAIGEIEETLGTSDGKIAAVSVEVGGFLGLAAKAVIVPLDQIRLEGLRLTLDLSKDAVRALPEWEG